MYHGDIRLGDTIDIKFTTVDTSGVPTTLAGTPVVSAYPGNSTTELTAGITLTVDFDSRTGMHNVRVVATGGNGYATATNYTLVITTGTVAGSSVVGYTVGSFSIEARSAVMPTVAGRTLDVSTGGEAGVDWANVGSPTTTVGLSGTTVGTATAVTTVNGLAANTVTAAAIADGAIDSATFAADTGMQTLRSNTAQAGGSGTITLDASASSLNDFYNGELIILTGGTGVGQARFVADYVGSTKVLTVVPVWTTIPDATTTFAIIPWGRVDIAQWLSIAPNALVSGRVDTSVGAMAANVVTASAIATDAITADKIAANAIGASELAADAVTEIADGILTRDWTAVTGEAARSVLNALRFLRNKWSITGTTLTVTKEDDTTTAFTSALTTSAGADPITASDPT